MSFHSFVNSPSAVERLRKGREPGLRLAFRRPQLPRSHSFFENRNTDAAPGATANRHFAQSAAEGKRRFG
jgi:hypothetical protein